MPLSILSLKTCNKNGASCEENDLRNSPTKPPVSGDLLFFNKVNEILYYSTVNSDCSNTAYLYFLPRLHRLQNR